MRQTETPTSLKIAGIAIRVSKVDEIMPLIIGAAISTPAWPAVRSEGI